MHSKDGMTAHRAWGWDPREMREAATMDEAMLDESSYHPHPAPTVSGFTPVNHPGFSDAAPIHQEHKDAAIKSKSADKPRATKRRKTQPSAAATASKPKKAATSVRTKTAKTAGQLDCLDIAHDLSRTKPTSSWEGSRSEKAKKQSKLSGLADRYQAAYPKVRGNVENQPTPPTSPKSDEVEAELNRNDQSHGQDFATERQASPNIAVEPRIQETPEFDGSIIVREFGAPPFTQKSPPILQDRNPQGTMIGNDFDPLDSTSDDLFEVDGIKRGDPGEEDEFPVDDECLEEMIQSMAVPAEEESLGSDWQSRNLSDDTLYINTQPENDQSHWPGPTPDSDGVVIYDEDPILVANDIADVPSSPQWSPQASCILTHVTGNANLDRARTSEGSENCFDDNDLDDNLIDLMVDNPKSLQVTSPVTPTDRPLSPKLQWLPPKTYAPAKSPRLPVPSTDGKHLVPVDSNGKSLPFMRSPFPKAVRDRSPILGLTNRTVLRICFRIGEALNAAAVSSRANVDSIIELYARVLSSSREASGGYKQFFQFGDLFTNKPPYLSGNYTFWKGVPLWDNDSKELVGEEGRGMMVRVSGRIKKKEPRQGQAPGAEMVVLSIWRVDWEDVGTAKGIACPK